MSVKQISTDQAPAPAGHYAQATVAGGMIYVSGQLPIRPDGSGLMREDFETQAEQAIANMIAVLRAAGGDTAHLARVNVYIVGAENWGRFNDIYAGMLPDAQPARTIVPVKELHYGYLVEVDAVGVLPA